MTINYDPNTPTPTLPFADWQPAFLQNFQQLYDAFAKNHVPLDSASNAGNHTIIELTEQQIPQQTNVSEIAVYTKNVPGQTDQIFLRYQGNGQEFQYTTYQLYSLGSFVAGQANQYFSFLPGNILCIFGFQPQGVTSVKLKPPVIRNIITSIITPIGPSPQQFAGVDFVVNSQTGIIVSMELKVAPSITRASGNIIKNPFKVPSLTYFILANI